jgi:hypothetical protein
MLAVDFDHATWFMVAHVSAADSEQGGEPYERGQKQLHVVSFPGVEVRSGIGGPVDPVGRSLSCKLAARPGIPKALRSGNDQHRKGISGPFTGPTVNPPI